MEGTTHTAETEPSLFTPVFYFGGSRFSTTLELRFFFFFPAINLPPRGLMRNSNLKDEREDLGNQYSLGKYKHCNNIGCEKDCITAGMHLYNIMPSSCCPVIGIHRVKGKTEVQALVNLCFRSYKTKAWTVFSHLMERLIPLKAK